MHRRSSKDKVADGEVHAVAEGVEEGEGGFVALCGHRVKHRLRYAFGNFAETKCEVCFNLPKNGPGSLV